MEKKNPPGRSSFSTLPGETKLWSVIIRELAEELRRAHTAKGKIAIVAGPAIVRTGAAEHLVRLIEAGYVDRLFAGNSFAAYDVEHTLFGTSLGMNPDLAFTRG